MSNLAPHPLFGRDVVPSGLGMTREDLVAANPHRYYPEGWVFPESAIPADLSRQSFSPVPVRFYVDTLKYCRACDRPFLFFAREQKFWYEDLGFDLGSHPVRCAECRREVRRQRFHFQRYGRLIGATEWTDDELATLVSDAVYLFEKGVLQREQTLRRLKNAALRRLPDHEATASILEVVARLDTT